MKCDLIQLPKQSGGAILALLWRCLCCPPDNPKFTVYFLLTLFKISFDRQKIIDKLINVLGLAASPSGNIGMKNEKWEVPSVLCLFVCFNTF